MRSVLPLFATALAASAPALAIEQVSVPVFHGIHLRGGGVVTVVPGLSQRVTIAEGSSAISRIQVTGDGELRIDACPARCPDHYRLKVVVQSPHAPDLAVSGGGLISTASGFGAQSHLSAAVDGGGKIDARSVNAANVSAAVNGGGELLINPRTTLSAAVNGGGRIRYLGHPNVSMAVEGGGTVSPGS